MPLKGNCAQCSALQEANDAIKTASEYARRGIDGKRLAPYNPAEATRLAKVAESLAHKAPMGHFHSKWYVSDYNDPSMMAVDRGGFVLVKEWRTDESQNDRLSSSMPLELWADHIDWWK